MDDPYIQVSVSKSLTGILLHFRRPSQLSELDGKDEITRMLTMFRTSRKIPMYLLRPNKAYVRSEMISVKLSMEG